MIADLRALVATARRKLEEVGIVRRTAHAGYPLRVDYDLTAPGLKLVPLIDALGDWWEHTEDDRAGRISSTAETKLGTAA